MSLLRLLTAGQSLVGMNQSGTRYRVTNRRLLPKFGSARNPFRSAQTHATRVQTAEGGEVEAQPALAPAQTRPAESLGGTRSSEVPQSMPMAEPLSPSLPLADGETGGEGTETPAAAPIQPAKAPGWLGRWARALTARFFRKRPRAARPDIPNFSQTPVQCELSLDRVKVMRNDLSDADLEVVPAKKPAAATRVRETGKRRPQPQAADGVRPSPGAASLEQASALEQFESARGTKVAAPGDGRTPAKPAPVELAGVSGSPAGLRQAGADKF